MLDALHDFESVAGRISVVSQREIVCIVEALPVVDGGVQALLLVWTNLANSAWTMGFCCGCEGADVVKGEWGPERRRACGCGKPSRVFSTRNPIASMTIGCKLFHERCGLRGGDVSRQTQHPHTSVLVSVIGKSLTTTLNFSSV